jgi:hypothetical protein
MRQHQQMTCTVVQKCSQIPLQWPVNHWDRWSCYYTSYNSRQRSEHIDVSACHGTMAIPASQLTDTQHTVYWLHVVATKWWSFTLYYKLYRLNQLWISHGFDTHRIPEPPGSQSKFTVGLLFTGAGAGSNTAPMGQYPLRIWTTCYKRSPPPTDYTTSYFLRPMDGYPIVTDCYITLL